MVNHPSPPLCYWTPYMKQILAAMHTVLDIKHDRDRVTSRRYPGDPLATCLVKRFLFYQLTTVINCCRGSRSSRYPDASLATCLVKRFLFYQLTIVINLCHWAPKMHVTHSQVPFLSISKSDTGFSHGRL